MTAMQRSKQQLSFSDPLPLEGDVLYGRPLNRQWRLATHCARSK